MTDVNLLFAQARGEVSKSQLPDGSYIPASELSAERRQNQKLRLKSNKMRGKSYYNQFTGPSKGASSLPGRGMPSVYMNHGVVEGIEDAVAHTKDARQSKVHPNIKYGHTITAEMEAKLDAQLHTKLTNSSKHPIAIHYGNIGGGAYAAATGAHVTTGGHGQVIINSRHFGANGRAPFGLHLGETANHEVAHALAHKKNPRRFFDPKDGHLIQPKTMGEEARADARGIYGDGHYRDVVHSEAKLQWAEKHDPTRHFPEFPEIIAGHRNYNQVHEKVQSAYGTKNRKDAPKPNIREEPEAPPQAPREAPKFTPPPGAPQPPPGYQTPRRLTRVGISGRRGVIGGAGLAAGAAAGLGWREYQHRRGHGGKFVSKAYSPDVQTLFDQARA